MVFKMNVANKGKVFKVESSDEKFVGMNIGDKLNGEEISSDLSGYELLITGTSDKAGFAGLATQNGPNLKKILLNYGIGLHKKPKGGSKKISNKRPNGLRLRKTVRGKEISLDTVQINTKVIKEGSKKFEELIANQPKTEKKK